MKAKLLFFSAIAALSITACQQKDDEPVGGKGGNAVLRVTTRHHNALIDSAAMVYIKYNASTAATSYDDSARVVAGATDTAAVFAGLKPGTYYLFGKGWDKGLSRMIDGGISFKITEEKTYLILCPVSEVH